MNRHMVVLLRIGAYPRKYLVIRSGLSQEEARELRTRLQDLLDPQPTEFWMQLCYMVFPVDEPVKSNVHTMYNMLTNSVYGLSGRTVITNSQLALTISSRVVTAPKNEEK